MIWTGQSDRLFIDGEWVSSTSDQAIDVVSPVTEEIIAVVPSASKTDVDRAVTAARRAFDGGPWRQMSTAQRLEIMHRFRDLYAQNAELFANLITEEMGCPISFSKVIQVGTPIAILDAYLDAANTFPFEALRSAPSGHALVTREPVGVVAAVLPWNVPQSVMMMKLAPALLVGCSIIIKPAPETPIDAHLTAELLQKAGVPDGVVSVLSADREVSEYLVTHPGVDKVAFTGSSAVGRRIASLCGEDLKRVTLELGGKSAAIFLDDADLDSAVESLRYLSLRNSGQVCSLKTRLVVSERREPELLERLVALVESMPVGNPSDPSVQIGPMVSARQRAVVESYIAAGREEGASAVVGGGRPAGFNNGWFVEPTIFSGVTPSMRIAQEEIFGPVLAVMTYENEDEAIAIANDSNYGLNGAVYTTDLDRGLSVARQLRTGTVELNGKPAGFMAPTGGFKWSGIGREAGPEGIEAYVEPRSIGLSEDQARLVAARLGSKP